MSRRPTFNFLVLSVILAGFVLPLIALSTLSLNVLANTYRSDIINVSCFEFMEFNQYASGVGFHSKACLETRNSVEDVSRWYEKRGWWCDGSCEGGRVLRAGPIMISAFRLMDIFPDDIHELKVPLRFDLYQSFSVHIVDP